MLMAYAINIDDAWGIVNVGNYQSLEDARKVFSSIYEDLWYKSDGTVKAVELVLGTDAGSGQGLEWFAFRSFRFPRAPYAGRAPDLEVLSVEPWAGGCGWLGACARSDLFESRWQKEYALSALENVQFFRGKSELRT